VKRDGRRLTAWSLRIEGYVVLGHQYILRDPPIEDKDHVKVFANVDAAEKWFEENDPEGVAFECSGVRAAAN
jgi:hypothetical protein